MIQTEKLKTKEKIGFCSFSMASNIVYQFKSLYYLFFLTNVLEIDMKTAGTLLTCCIIWDAVNDPLVGFFAINHKFKSNERVRPFALYCAVPWAITTVAIFTNFHTSKALTIIIAAIAYFAFELLNTCVAIPYNSMGSLATNRDEDRRSLNIFRNIGGCLGTAIGAVACLPLLKLFGALDSKGNLDPVHGSRGFFLTACIMGFICIVGCFIHYFTTKERVKDEENAQRVSMIDTFKALYSYKPFVMNTLYILCYGIINLLLLTTLTYYCTYVIGSTAAVTPIQAVYLAFSLLTSLFVSPIDKKIGRKNTMLLAGLFYVVGKIWFVFDPHSIAALYLNCATTGMAVAITFVMFNTNRNNLADLIAYKENRRFDGMIGTADNFATKLGEALAAKLLTLSLAYAGFESSLAVQSESTLKAITALIGWVPGVVGLVLIIIVLGLNIETEMKKMQNNEPLK